MDIQFPDYKPTKGSKGVIYIVQDSEEYLRECIFSAKSVKKYHPELPITLFTNLKVGKSVNCFNSVVFSDTKLHPFKSKVYHIAASPYEKTLFLDTDTQALLPIIDLFQLLENHDIALAHEPYKGNYEECKKAKDFANVKAFNTGVILFSYTPKMYSFLTSWFEAINVQPSESLNYFNSDQDYFNHLVMEDKLFNQLGIHVAVLDNKIYNVRTWIIQSLKEMDAFKNVKLLHHRGLHLNAFEKLVNKIGKKLKLK